MSGILSVIAVRGMIKGYLKLSGTVLVDHETVMTERAREDRYPFSSNLKKCEVKIT
jgi:hypothetical protein